MINRLLILYAGETGNSQDVARFVYRQSRRYGIPVKGISIEDYPMGQLVNESLVLFICSTTGQGNEPSPLKKFWPLIMRKNLPTDTLINLKAAVIGLGDSSYIKYNVVSKKLYKRLQSLGAEMLLDLALGDDQHDLGLWATVDPWLQKFWDKLKELIPISVTKGIKENEFPEASYQVELLTNDATFGNEQSLIINESNGAKINQCTVISNERVTPENHFQQTQFVKISLDNQLINYEPGDVALIFPNNLPDEVDEFILLLNLNSKMKMKLIKVDQDFSEDNGYDRLPLVIDVKTLVTSYMDIHSVPKRSFFDLLWRFSDDDLERTKLKEFASTDGQQDLYTYCSQPKRNILEVLKDFPQTCSKIPFNYLFDLIPSIRPRAFSIASSLSLHPNQLHLLVAVVSYRTKLRKPRLGLCSNYLARVVNGEKIRLSTRKGDFKVPQNEPLIMVGPGTGVAPFRAIIQERYCQKNPFNTLFFGCRYSNCDYYFKNEWKDYEEKGFLKLFTAFSRDDADKKWYVQDEMKSNMSLISDLIFSKGAIILIAGSSNQMPHDVRNCIKDILLSYKNQFNSDEVEKIVSKLEAARKIQYECWS